MQQRRRDRPSVELKEVRLLRQSGLHPYVCFENLPKIVIPLWLKRQKTNSFVGVWHVAFVEEMYLRYRFESEHFDVNG